MEHGDIAPVPSYFSLIISTADCRLPLWQKIGFNVEMVHQTEVSPLLCGASVVCIPTIIRHIIHHRIHPRHHLESLARCQVLHTCYNNILIGKYLFFTPLNTTSVFLNCLPSVEMFQMFEGIVPATQSTNDYQSISARRIAFKVNPI